MWLSDYFDGADKTVGAIANLGPGGPSELTLKDVYVEVDEGADAIFFGGDAFFGGGIPGAVGAVPINDFTRIFNSGVAAGYWNHFIDPESRLGELIGFRDMDQNTVGVS